MPTLPHAQFNASCRGALRLAATCLVLCVWYAKAQLPQARLDSIFPPGGPQGGTIETVIAGQFLDQTGELRFSHPGIAAKPKPDSGSALQGPNTFVVTIASNVPPALYEVRARSRFGLSNPRVFAVGVLPEERDNGSNHSRDTAQTLALGRVVYGTAEGREVDWYKIALKRGQRLWVECLGPELDSRFQPVLVLLDPAGREVNRNRIDGRLEFRATSEGDHRLQVQDFLYRGGAEYFYRLSAHQGPQVDFVWPPSGLPGTQSSFTLYGRNLPGGKPAGPWTESGLSWESVAVNIELPSDDQFLPLVTRSAAGEPGAAAAAVYEWRWESPLGPANPAGIGKATAPVVLELEPNDDPAKAQQVTWPCEVAGQFYPSGDLDCYQFEAEKGAVLWVEVISERLGQPVRPFLVVQRVTVDDQGQRRVADVEEVRGNDANAGGVDFNTSTPDPAWRFEVKESGTYRIQARDLFAHARPSPAHVYRLSLRKESPDFALAAVPASPMPEKNDVRIASPRQSFLRRGETWPLKVVASRRDGFNGVIVLKAEGLPPGVQAAPAVIPEGKSSGLVYLTADTNAPAWAGSITLVGEATVGPQKVTRHASGGTVVWHVGDYNNERVQARLSRDVALGVSDLEVAPVQLAPAEDKVWAGVTTNDLEIPLRVLRVGEFKETLKFKVAGSEPLEKTKELEIKEGETNATLKLEIAKNSVPAGEYTLALRTVTKGKYRNQADAAERAEAESKKGEAEAGEAAAAAKKAAEAAEGAAKAFKEKEEQAKAAEAGLAGAKASASQAAEDAQKQTAVAQAEEQAARARDAAATAAKERDETQKAKDEAEAKSKRAEERKKQLAEAAKAAVERAKPKDVNITVYSQPILLKLSSPDPKSEEKKVAKN